MRKVTVMLTLATLVAHVSHAQEVSFVSVADFQTLNARLAEYESQLASYDMSHAGADAPACLPCETSPGLSFGAELLFLKPFESEGEAPGFDYQPAPRVWLGWTCATGLGVRARWFDYHNRNLNNVGVPPLIEDFDLSVVDIEVTDKFQLGHWHGLLTGGVRYADYEELGFFDADQMDDSVGLLLGLEIKRPATDCLALFATTRGSLQFAPRGLDNGAPVEDMTFSIAEAQLGLEWSGCGPHGGNWFVRGAAEAQYWSGGVIGDGDTEDLGLFGGIVSFGLSR